MKFEPIGNLVGSVQQCNPDTLGRPWIIYLDIASVDNAAKQVVAPQRIAADLAPSRARQLVNTDDVLVSTVRPNLNAVALVQSKFDGEVASTGFCVLRPKKTDLSPGYLFYFAQTAGFVSHLSKIATGASYPAVTDNDIFETPIPLPTLAEQQRIAGLLEQADRLRRTRRYAFELSDTTLPAAFLKLFGDPDKNPKKTSLVAAGDLFDIQLGKMLDAKRYTGKHLRSYLGNANVQWGRFALDDLKKMDFPENDFEKFKLLRGDLLVCEGGEVGRTAIWMGEVADCCYQKALHRLRRTCEDILPVYFLHYMHAAVVCGLVARHSSTATIGHFTKETFEEFPVMLPPLDSQSRFASLVTCHERLQARQREALRQADHLFQSLLHRAFS